MALAYARAIFCGKIKGSHPRGEPFHLFFDECDRLRRHVSGEVSRLERERVLT